MPGHTNIGYYLTTCPPRTTIFGISLIPFRARAARGILAPCMYEFLESTGSSIDLKYCVITWPK